MPFTTQQFAQGMLRRVVLGEDHQISAWKNRLTEKGTSFLRELGIKSSLPIKLMTPEQVEEVRGRLVWQIGQFTMLDPEQKHLYRRRIKAFLNALCASC